VEQAITFTESLFRVGIRFYLANVHRDRIVTGFWTGGPFKPDFGLSGAVR
jgi:hypothetical protein